MTSRKTCSGKACHLKRTENGLYLATPNLEEGANRQTTISPFNLKYLHMHDTLGRQRYLDKFQAHRCTVIITNACVQAPSNTSPRFRETHH
eukprot:1127253-Prorocentrum_minimum.AAC.6